MKFVKIQLQLHKNGTYIGSIVVYHNIPQSKNVSMSDVMSDWMETTDSISAKSFCNYVNNHAIPDSGYMCITEMEYLQKHN